MVEPGLLLDWSFEIRRLRRLRELDASVAEERCGVRVSLLEDRLSIAQDRAEGLVAVERDRADALVGLEREDRARLVSELEDEKEVGFFEHPAFWFALGAVVVIALGGLGVGLVLGLQP